VALGQDTTLSVSAETIHAPAEVGVDGALLSGSWSPGRSWTLSAVYGRIGLGDLVRTETSPEALGGEIPAYAQVISVGAARLTGRWTLGTALRLLTGRLDTRSETQLGLDLGAVYRGGGTERWRLGLATRFLDPRLGEREQAASYAVAVEHYSLPFALSGAESVLLIRYGATFSHGEGAQHLISGGLKVARVLELDAGAAYERAVGAGLWRSRLGLTLNSGRYSVLLARDGGVNGFGAAYRVGLMVVFP
jgi:hypothetical protein